jgi:hypothetical protein
VSVIFADSYSLAPEPQALVSQLVARCDEFAHLVDMRAACVWSEQQPMLRGAPCAAFIGYPRVQGPFSPLFAWCMATVCAPLFEQEEPDFLIIFDHALWPTLEGERQERLVYHELCHVVAREDEYGQPRFSNDDGRVLLKLVPHDYEFFDQEVRRYGPDVCNLDGAAVAIADGYRAAERRNRSAA